MRIVIETRGSVVIGIYSDVPNIDMEILDWDDVRVGQIEEKEVDRITTLMDELEQIY